MASKILKIIAVIAFLGSIYWIYSNPRDVEPYVTAVLLLGGLISTFWLSANEKPKLWCKAVGLENLIAGELPRVVFEFENTGNADAKNLRIESGIYTSNSKLESDPPPMEFNSPASVTILPTAKTMTKTLTFGREITASEVDQIINSLLYVYAYAVLTYTSENKSKIYELKTCSLYNPRTTYFNHTNFFNIST